MKRVLLFLSVFTAFVASRTLGAERAGEQSAAEAEIRKIDTAYVEAFNKHDAEALAAFWSPDAVYLNRQTGDDVVGRAEIAKQFKEYFNDQPDVKMTVDTESIQFVSPNVAVETGTSKEWQPKEVPEEDGYSAVFVKRDGQWLLDRITDDPKPVVPSHYEQLKPLEWMVGQWIDQDKTDNIDIETDVAWTKNKNFLTRSFAISAVGKLTMSGMQIIGWDPSNKTIRCWTFDSEGGFSDGTLTHKGDRWYISNKGVLPDGKPATMVNVVKQVDENSFTWRTIERTADGVLLPNVDEVLIVRK